MIERYCHKEISKLWSDQSRFEIWLEVETLALEAMVNEGLAPQEALDAVKSKAKFDTSEILRIEAEVKHDVIAFLTNVAESVGPLSRYIHRGMTSNDLLDTTLAVQLKRSAKIILAELDSALEAILNRANEFKYTPCIGRSHGIHAEPISFGVKLMTWYAELSRQRARFLSAIEDVCVGKIAGAVGTYASLPPSVESFVMDKLGLRPEDAATQVVDRDRHARFFTALAEIGGSIERFAVEIRHLQRTEVGEAQEFFSAGQKGSSAMPHKRNPILSENMTGAARLLRGYALSSMENVALWHERDISHSSVERVIAPDACTLAGFTLKRFSSVVQGLVVYPDKMLENINLTGGLVYSGSLLIALVDCGITREDAYKLVQDIAKASLESDKSFKELVFENPQISDKLEQEQIEAAFDPQRHLKQVDMIFDRVLENSKA